MDERDVRLRLKVCLAPPYHTCIFSEELVDGDIVSKVIIGRGLQGVLGARKVSSSNGELTFVIVYMREERCWSDCLSKCGSYENRNFVKCFIECMHDTYLFVKNSLEAD